MSVTIEPVTQLQQESDHVAETVHDINNLATAQVRKDTPSQAEGVLWQG